MYTLDRKTPHKAQAATTLVSKLAHAGRLVISLQVLNELTNALLLKRRELSHADVRAIVRRLSLLGDDPLSPDIVELGWRIRENTGYRWWDCLLVATANAKRCRYFISEDMQHERTVLDVTIINPFVTSPLDFAFSN